MLHLFSSKCPGWFEELRLQLYPWTCSSPSELPLILNCLENEGPKYPGLLLPHKDIHQPLYLYIRLFDLIWFNYLVCSAKFQCYLFHSSIASVNKLTVELKFSLLLVNFSPFTVEGQSSLVITHWRNLPDAKEALSLEHPKSPHNTFPSFMSLCSWHTGNPWHDGYKMTLESFPPENEWQLLPYLWIALRPVWAEFGGL